MPDDHSKVVPLLPIPNRTVKRLSADDSADSRVKVGHRQAITAANAQSEMTGRFAFGGVRISPCGHADNLEMQLDIASIGASPVPAASRVASH